MLCVHVDSHPKGTYKHGLYSEINDHGFRRHDLIAYQQIGTEALNKIDLTLIRGLDQVSNIVFAREVQGQCRKPRELVFRGAYASDFQWYRHCVYLLVKKAF